MVLILGWIISVFSNQSSIFDVELEPDDNDNEEENNSTKIEES